MMWGSFGEINMSKVHEEYYGRDNGLYERLQSLKQEVDPLDHFHTPFTVQLPDIQAYSVGAGGHGAHDVHGAHGGHGADERSGKRAKRRR